MVSLAVPLPARLLEAAPAAGAHPWPRRPTLRTPFYARDAVAAAAEPQLHEYRGADFMAHFAADLAGNRLAASIRQSWHASNALDGDGHPRLRQPIHDGFTLVCCELTCGGRSAAPLDPARIGEAWVRLAPPDETPGLPGRLAPAPTGRRWPLRPRVATDGAGRRHTLLVGLLPVSELPAAAAGGPAEDPARLQAAADTLAERVGAPPATVDRDYLLWRPPAAPGQGAGALDSRLGGLVQLLDESLGLGSRDGVLVHVAEADGSPPITDWRDWLDAVHFYREPDPAPYQRFRDAQVDYRTALSGTRAALAGLSVPAAAAAAPRDALQALRQTLAGGAPARTPARLRFERIADYGAARIAALTDPWRAHLETVRPLLRAARTALPLAGPLAPVFMPLADQLRAFERVLSEAAAAATALDAQFADPLAHRAESLLDWLLRGRGDQTRPLPEQLPGARKLIAPGAWLAAGPPLIRARWTALVRAVTANLPAGPGASDAAAPAPGNPDPGGDPDRLYRISVQARVRGDHGCEYALASDPSPAFRIASFHDTRLMPNRPIPMPTLKDLKRALAGPAMVLPPDTAAEVARLRFADGEVQQGDADAGGMRWIYVFSLPVVTLCAMILLMLMINLLNFVFRWLPFAILRIPFPR